MEIVVETEEDEESASDVEAVVLVGAMPETFPSLLSRIRNAPSPEAAWRWALSIAQAHVARDERKALEHITAQRASPMEAETAAIEGPPPGDGGQPRDGVPGAKRTRPSPPDSG